MRHRVAVCALAVLLAAPAVAWSSPSAAPAAAQRIRFTVFCVSDRVDTTSCAGLHAVKPGGTLSGCSSKVQSIVARIVYSGVSTRRPLPYLLTLAGPGATPSSSPLGFATARGSSTLFADALQFGVGGSTGRLTAGVYRESISLHGRTLARGSVKLSTRNC